MAAVAGTKVGTGFVDIEPDFSRFQEKVGRQLNQALAPVMRKAGGGAGKELARGIDGGTLGQALRRRFGRIGDDAGKELAAKVSKGAKRAEGDMFGLADAVKEVERRTRKASGASKDLERDMFGINRMAKQSGRSLRSVSTQLSDYHSNVKSADSWTRLFTGRLRNLGYELGNLRKGVRTSSGGLSGFDGVMARVNRGAQFFRNILRTIKWPVFIAGLGLSLQGLSALAAGAIAATGALGGLSGALIAIPAAALAGAQAFGALKLATAGVGDAVKAALDAEVSGGGQAVDVMRQQKDAAERVADAKRNLADQERIATLAADDYRRAHEEARREMEDLRFAADEADESIESAAIGLRRAKEELRRAERDPEASVLDVREAELAVEQAQNDLRRVRSEASRARKDYSEAQEVGVRGMAQVVAAKEAEEDAERAVVDARRDVRRATEDASAAMAEQGAAASALHEKMSQLPPAAQKFVRFLVAMKPRLDALRDTAAEGFFLGATKGLRGLMGNFREVRGLVAGTSSAIGRLAAKAGRRLGSAAWGRDLTQIGKLNTRIIDRLGDSTLNFGDALRHTLVSAEPFLDWMSEGTEEFSAWVEAEAEAGRETGKLSEFFDRTRATMERIWPILRGVGGAFLNISEAADDFGNEILESLGRSAEGWRRWTDSTKGQNALKRYFTETKPAVFEMGRLIRDAGKAFFELGKQDGVADLLRLVRTELIPAMRDLVGTTTGWAARFLEDFGRLRKQGVPAFDAFVQVLAEHAAEAGWRIARGLANAFLNAGIWGKLAISGWLLAKFGGFRALGKWGAEAGGRLGKSLFERAWKWIAGTAAGESLLGNFNQTFSKDGKFGKAARTGGMRAGRLLGRGIALGAVVGIASLAPLITDAIRKYIKEPVQSAWEDIFGEDVGGAINDVADTIGQNFPKAGNPTGVVLGEIFKDDEPHEVPEPKTEKARRGFERFRKQVGKEAELTRNAFRNQMAPIPGIAEQNARGAVRQWLPRLDTLKTQGGEKGDAFANRLGGSFGSVAGAARRAFDNIEKNIRGSLKALGGATLPSFNLKLAPKLLDMLPPLAERQRGGEVPRFATGGLAAKVPGASTGDRHLLSLNGRPIAKVESREGIFVGNREYMGALERGNAEHPRFQTGGVVREAVQGYKRGGLVEPELTGPAGPLRELGQSAIGKVFEGAKDYLAKHKTQFGGGGDIANAGPLEQFNHTYPEHGLSDTAGRARFSESLVARIARWAGLPGKLFAQIAHGESNFYPGITGIDPGGTKGYGLWMVTTSFNDALVRKYGGYGQMLNPLKNAKAAKEIYDARGDISAWYGTKFVTGMREGGILKLARRGRADSGGNPFNPHAMRGGPAEPPFEPLSAVGFKPKTIGRIKNKAKEIAAAFTGYVWGGGHGEGTNVRANGVDCSGAIAKLVQQSGWKDFAVAHSSEYARRFHQGVGDLFTLWSNNDHTFAEIEGQMWGTNSSNGLGYHSHTTAGFTPTHPTLASEGGASTGTTGRGSKVVPKIPDKAPFKTKGGATGAGGGTAAGAEGEVPTSLSSFGPLPDTLEGCRKELALRRSQLWEQRQALRTAKGKKQGRVAKALEGNIAKLLDWIRKLKRQQFKLAVEARIGRKGKLTKRDAAIDGARLDYERLSETAEQTLALEPDEGPAAKNYIAGVETPAWQAAWGALGNWRNAVLGAQEAAVGRVASIRQQVASIRALKGAKPQAWKKHRFKIGPLEKAANAILGKFNPGPPPSGSYEEALTEVQGPGKERTRGALSAEPEPGRFGGLVWDTQLQLRELGLKLKQSTEGSGEGDSERASLLEEIIRNKNVREMTETSMFKVFRDFEKTYPMRKFPPYAGEFHTGGIVPGPSNREVIAKLRGQEGVFTPEQMSAMGEGGGGTVLQIDQLILHEDGAVTARMGKEEVRGVAREVVREETRESSALRLR